MVKVVPAVVSVRVYVPAVVKWSSLVAIPGVAPQGYAIGSVPVQKPGAVT